MTQAGHRGLAGHTVTSATIKSKAQRRPAPGVALTGKAARQMERRPSGRVSTAEAAATATATRPARASSQGSSARRLRPSTPCQLVSQTRQNWMICAHAVIRQSSSQTARSRRSEIVRARNNVSVIAVRDREGR